MSGLGEKGFLGAGRLSKVMGSCLGDNGFAEAARGNGEGVTVKGGKGECNGAGERRGDCTGVRRGLGERGLGAGRLSMVRSAEISRITSSLSLRSDFGEERSFKGPKGSGSAWADGGEEDAMGAEYDFISVSKLFHTCCALSCSGTKGVPGSTILSANCLARTWSLA